MRITIISMLGAFAATTLLWGCNDNASTEPDAGKWEYTETIDLTRGEEETLEKINGFGYRLMAEACKASDEDGAFCLSPVSLSLYLCSAANFTAGDCRAEIMNAHDTDTLHELNSLARKLMQYLPNDNHESSLAICNRIWIDKHNNVPEEVELTLSDYYNTGIEKVDFSNRSSLSYISKWLREQTNGLCVPCLDSWTILGELPMISTNTIYFKGEWAKVFNPDRTSPGVFHGVNGDVETQFMHADLCANYAENEHLKYLTLSFEGDWDRMDFLLPAENVSVAELAEWLDEDKIMDIRRHSRSCDVIASIPKFQSESSHDLIDILETLGMPSLQDADLSPLGVKSRGMVAAVQATFLKVDERGAELAAISSGETVIKNMEDRDTVTFDLNRPFLYQVRNNRTGAILIGGAVVKF